MTNSYLRLPRETHRPTNEDIICVTCSAYIHDPATHDKWHNDGQPMTAEDKTEVLNAIQEIIRTTPPPTRPRTTHWAVPVVLVDPTKCYHPEDQK